MPVVSVVDFRVPALVLLAKFLCWWCLLYVASICGASFKSFSKVTGFDVCLDLVSLPSARKVCFYFRRSDLASLLVMLKEIHRVVRRPLVGRHRNWPL